MQTDPTVEFEHITQWSTKLVGKAITATSLTRSLARHLNKRHPVIVRTQASKELEQGDFTIGAFYEPTYDEQGRKPLIIVLITSPTLSVQFDNNSLHRLNVELLEALVHELQHQHQYRSRGHIINRSYTSVHHDPTIKNDQEYLGSADEIDAYAANIAARFFVLRGTMTPANSFDLKNYYHTFGPHHPVVKRLLKKIVKNLVYLQENDRTLR